MIGLVGSHRTGKTTTAKTFAEEYDFEFLQTNTSEVFKKHDIDPKKDYSFRDRLFIQMLILDNAIAVYDSAKSHAVITDRTPVDMLAYTMADIQRENMNEELANIFFFYAEACIRATNKYFSMIALIQPGIPLKEDPDKAPANPAYMAHINTLCKGLMLDSEIMVPAMSLGEDLVDLDDRVMAIDIAYQNVMAKMMNAASEEVAH